MDRHHKARPRLLRQSICVHGMRRLNPTPPLRDSYTSGIDRSMYPKSLAAETFFKTTGAHNQHKADLTKVFEKKLQLQFGDKTHVSVILIMSRLKTCMH